MRHKKDGQARSIRLVVAQAAPDGFTLGLAVPGVMAVNPYVYKNMPFKPPVALVGQLSVVRPAQP